MDQPDSTTNSASRIQNFPPSMGVRDMEVSDSLMDSAPDKSEMVGVTLT